MKIEAVIFDMDGVICDSAKYHYQGWKKLAQHLGFDLTEDQNEALKGLSRYESMLALIELGNLELTEQQISDYMEMKNQWYLDLIQNMNETDLLPGAISFIETCRKQKLKVALGSSSKNAQAILNYLNINYLFDAVVDGTQIRNSKPHPEVFLLGAKKLGVQPQNTIVFEDATSGVEAALNGNFKCVGIGDKNVLTSAHIVYKNLAEIKLNELQNFFTNN